MRSPVEEWSIEPVSKRRWVMSGKRFSTDEARAYGAEIGIDWEDALYDVEEFRTGMNVELEHGLHDPDTDVTGDNPIATAKIARAHLNEFPDYYTRLKRMEEEARKETKTSA
jgi:hypothetical protein